MIDTGSNTSLPIGADTTADSQKETSSFKAIRSLRPILQLMNIYFDGTEWHYEIDRNLKWDVVLARTAEVGEIIINSAEEAIPPAAYMYIPRSLAGACLFPNLTRLQLINKPLQSSLCCLSLFVSPRLHSLEIDNISQDDIPGLDHFLQDPDLQVSLTHITLGPIRYSPRILRGISNCTSVQTATLTFLDSKPLDDEAVRLLGAIPKLQSLTIKADHVPYTPAAVVHAAVPNGFAALRDISVIGDYSFIESIFAATKADAPIHTLNVTISSARAARPQGKNKPRRMDTLRLLSLVAEKWSFSLYDFILVIALGNFQGTISSLATLSPECIGHLTELSGIRRLVVSGFHLSGLNDVLQKKIARSAMGGLLWPNIQDIQFLGQQIRTTISLSAFRHLVQHCANLVSFGGLIELPTTMDSLSQAFDENPTQSHLRQLSTGSLGAIEWNHNMIQIARFLERLCPDLDKPITHAEFAATTWDSIYGIITIFREVRQEERAAVMRGLSANFA